MLILRGKVLALENLCRNTGSLCFGKATSFFLVGKDRHHFRRKIGGLRSADQRLHIGAAARNEDDDPLAAHSESVPL